MSEDDIPDDLTAFQRDCLRIIERDGPCNGQAVKDGLSDYYTDHINHGRLYPNLDTLVEKGLVTKTTHKPNDRSHEFRISKRGKRTLNAYREFLSPSFAHTRAKLETFDDGAADRAKQLWPNEVIVGNTDE